MLEKPVDRGDRKTDKEIHQKSFRYIVFDKKLIKAWLISRSGVILLRDFRRHSRNSSKKVSRALSQRCTREMPGRRVLWRTLVTSLHTACKMFLHARYPLLPHTPTHTHPFPSPLAPSGHLAKPQSHSFPSGSPLAFTPPSKPTHPYPLPMLACHPLPSSTTSTPSPSGPEPTNFPSSPPPPQRVSSITFGLESRT